MRLSVLLVVAALALCSAQFSPHARGDWSSPPIADTGAGGVGLDLGNLFHNLVRDDADALELHSNAEAAEDMEELDSMHERLSPLFHSIFDRLRGMVETRGEAEDHEAHVDPRLARYSRAALRVLRMHCNDVLGRRCPEAQTRDQMVTCLVRAGSHQPLEAKCEGALHRVLDGNPAQVVAEAEAMSGAGGEEGVDALGGHYQRLRDMFRGVRDMFGVGDGSDLPPPPMAGGGGGGGEPPMPPGHEKMPGEHAPPPPPPPPHHRRGHRGRLGRGHGKVPPGQQQQHAEEDENDVTDVAKVGELHNEIKCRREADRLCAATHGHDRHRCMLKSVDNVSPLCKKMLVTRVLGPCADEAERVCAHTTEGERVGESTVQCLLDQRSALTDECFERLDMLVHVEEDEHAAAMRERARKAAEKAKRHREKHEKKKKQHEKHEKHEKHKHRRHEREDAADRTAPATPSSSVGMIVAAVCAGMVLMAGVMLGGRR